MKKTSFKILCVVLCLAIGVAIVSVVGFAVSNNRIYADSVTAEPGSTIEIPVCISNNAGFMGISLEFSYDSSAMMPVSVAKGKIITSGLFDDSLGTVNKPEFKVIWCGTGNITKDGEVCILKFNVSDSAAGEYKIKVSYESQNTFDENYEAVKLNCEDITVTIQNNEAPAQKTLWQKIVDVFVKVWKWFIGLFSK